MNTHFFKKKQEQNYQFCKCSLSSAGGINEQKGEKFLVRLQRQSSKGNIQVNMINKLVSNRKDKQSKQSLKPKEKKHESIHKIIDKGFSTPRREDLSVFPNVSYSLPRVCNRYQTIIDLIMNRNQRNDYTLVNHVYYRQPPHQIRVERKLQNNYKEAMTERSTQGSNANQLRSRIQVVPPKGNDICFVNNATISVIQQKQIDQVNCLPRSKSFSLNLRRKQSADDTFKNINQHRQLVVSNNQPAQQINQFKMMPSLKLNDLMFKSVESFHEGSSDQYSELASEIDYHSNPNINQNTWSHSLNQIFVKKMRRMSHNTNS